MPARRTRQAYGLRHEERAERQRRPPRREKLGVDDVEPVAPRVEVEDELPLGEVGHATEERRTVAGVVQRAEHRRRGDRASRRELVDVRELDLRDTAEPGARGIDHRRTRIDADVVQSEWEKVLGQPGVAAREIEHCVAVLQRWAERAHELGPPTEVTLRVGVGLVGPAPGSLGAELRRRHRRAAVGRTTVPKREASSTIAALAETARRKSHGTR